MAVIRSTWNGRLRALADATARVGQQVAEKQVQAVTGLEVARPSDAPSAIPRLQAIEAQATRAARWEETAATADSLLSVADQALGSLSDLVSRARELAVAMSSGTYTDAQRQDAAAEAEALIEEAVSAGNAELAGRHVFAGDTYDAAAFAANGTYEGGAAAPSAEVGEGVDVALGFDGASLFGDDVFPALVALTTALAAGDEDGVAATLDGLEAATEALSGARSTVGAHQSTAEDAALVAETLGTELTRQSSAITDADAVETLVRLSELQTSYEAALKVTAAARGTTLFSLL